MHSVSPLQGLIAQLQADRAALLAAVEHVPPALRQQRPSPERWSVAEIIEHLSIIEPRVVGLMSKLVADAPMLSGAEPTGPLDFDRSSVQDRTRVIMAPPPLHPSGGVDATTALADLERARADLYVLLNGAHDRDLGAVSKAHPFFGPLNGFQWLGVHAGHESRHTAQIEEAARVVTPQAVSQEPLHARTGEAFEGDIRLTVMGRQLRVGDRAPDFSLDALAPGEALPREVTMAGGAGRVRVLHVVNSLDTPVCHVGAHKFDALRTYELPAGVDVYTVSMDLPFAQARWRDVEKVNHEALSSHRSEAFGQAYGVLLQEWRLLQRAVFVIDASGTVVYAEYVGDQMAEPDYAAAVAAARAVARPS